MSTIKVTARFSERSGVYEFDPVDELPSLTDLRTNELSGVFMYVSKAVVTDKTWGEFELRFVGDRYDGQVYKLSFESIN